MFSSFILIQFILHYYTNIYDGAKQGLNKDTSAILWHTSLKKSSQFWVGRENKSGEGDYVDTAVDL